MEETAIRWPRRRRRHNHGNCAFKHKFAALLNQNPAARPTEFHRTASGMAAIRFGTVRECELSMRLDVTRSDDTLRLINLCLSPTL
jgi:hypothetical protein